jgi:hypothetical protein
MRLSEPGFFVLCERLNGKKDARLLIARARSLGLWLGTTFA